MSAHGVAASRIGTTCELCQVGSTLRSIVAGTGVSTMAVYTYFGGMDGLWQAIRQEGFTRLTVTLKAVPLSADPVRDLAALGAAYLINALANPGPLPRHTLDHGAPMLTAGGALSE